MAQSRHILFLLLGALLAVSVSGCSEDLDELLTKQEDDYASFFSSSHTPRLVTEEQAAEAPQEMLPFYTETGNTAYRYIATWYDEGREARKEVEWGSEVTLTFRLYVFNKKAITETTAPIYTNDFNLAQALGASLGLNVAHWTFEPLVVHVGESRVMEGLTLSLPGCREGDVVEVYMTSNMAYGSELLYTIPQNTPMALFFTVDKVE